MEGDVTERSGPRERRGGSAQHRGAADQRTEEGKETGKESVMNVIIYRFFYVCVTSSLLFGVFIAIIAGVSSPPR